jgi:anti-sigma-K factor RskA
VDPAGRLVVAMRDLPATSGTQVYEAWLIGADNKPVPAGSFAVGSSGVGILTGSVGSAEAGVVVALTREPAPDATTPTLPIVAKGAAHSATG